MSVDYFVVATETNPPRKTSSDFNNHFAHCHPSEMIGDDTCLDFNELLKFAGRKIDDTVIKEVMSIRNEYDQNKSEGQSAEKFMHNNFGNYLFFDAF